MTPKRIFIFGLQRSGTTWLANMLAALPDIAAVEAKQHHGVHESVFFSHFAKAFGPWEYAEARTQFLDAFEASDYFILSDMEPEIIEEVEQVADSYGDFFIRFMDLLALGAGALGWIEKSPHHTFLATEILQSAPDAKFVMVQRKVSDLVLSRLHGFGRTPKKGLRRSLDIVRGSIAAVSFQREMRRLKRSGLGLLIRYEDLKNDPDNATRQKILDYIGIDADPAAMISNYGANTSFTTQQKRPLSVFDRMLIGLGVVVARVVPQKKLKAIQKKRQEKNGISWPEWVWQISDFDPKESAEISKHRIVLDVADTD